MEGRTEKSEFVKDFKEMKEQAMKILGGVKYPMQREWQVQRP